MTLDQILASGELDGYVRRAPAHNPLVEGIDAEVCAGSTCRNCRHVGLEWVPFVHRRGTPSYRPFAVCPACSEASEF